MKDLYQIVPKFEIGDLKDKICFYGGTFHPWHAGHSICVQKFLAQAENEDLVILPDHNPWKNSEVMSEDRKIEILQTILKETKHKYIDPRFLLSEDKNPTYNWVKTYKETYPSKSLALLIGFDNFAKIFDWYEAQKLLKLIDRLYVVSRMDDEQKSEAVQAKITKLAPHLNVIFLGHHQYEALSSTSLRKKGS